MLLKNALSLERWGRCSKYVSSKLIYKRILKPSLDRPVKFEYKRKANSPVKLITRTN